MRVWVLKIAFFFFFSSLLLFIFFFLVAQPTSDVISDKEKTEKENGRAAD